MDVETLQQEKNRLLSENTRLYHALDQSQAAIADLLNHLKSSHAQAREAQEIARDAIALAQSK